MIGSVLYLVEVAGTVILMAGSLSGLYIFAVALVANVAFLISAAWLLVVSVYSARMQVAQAAQLAQAEQVEPDEAG